MLDERPELMGNKFWLPFDPGALHCMHERIFNRTYSPSEEYKKKFEANLKFYENLPAVKFQKWKANNPGRDWDEFPCVFCQNCSHWMSYGKTSDWVVCLQMRIMLDYVYCKAYVRNHIWWKRNISGRFGEWGGGYAMRDEIMCEPLSFCHLSRPISEHARIFVPLFLPQRRAFLIICFGSFCQRRDEAGLHQAPSFFVLIQTSSLLQQNESYSARSKTKIYTVRWILPLFAIFLCFYVDCNVSILKCVALSSWLMNSGVFDDPLTGVHHDVPPILCTRCMQGGIHIPTVGDPTVVSVGYRSHLLTHLGHTSRQVNPATAAWIRAWLLLFRLFGMQIHWNLYSRTSISGTSLSGTPR